MTQAGSRRVKVRKRVHDITIPENSPERFALMFLGPVERIVPTHPSAHVSGSDTLRSFTTRGSSCRRRQKSPDHLQIPGQQHEHVQCRAAGSSTRRCCSDAFADRSRGVHAIEGRLGGEEEDGRACAELLC